MGENCPVFFIFKIYYGLLLLEVKGMIINMNKTIKILFPVSAIIVCLTFGLIFLNEYSNKNNVYSIKKIYNKWKKRYVVSVKDNISRVVDPEDNNVTLSEGIGYGMLFSAAMEDKSTFDNLYNYSKLYLDKNGLMHWKIDAFGNVIGTGSATDADEDIAYSLLLAYKNFKDDFYLNEAKKVIESISKHEINSEYIILPGDSWGNSPPFNPSYISPLYYNLFANVSDKYFWNKVLNKNMDLLYKNMNVNTGFLPDWIEQDGKIKNENNKFGYDAIRVPIRLLHFFNETKDSKSLSILTRQYEFIKGIGADNLVAGYSLSGKPLVTYINSAYLASYCAISRIDKESNFSKNIMNKLIANEPNDYYGSSLKLWILLILNNKL